MATDGTCGQTHDVQHDVVTQAGGAVHPHQDSVLQGGAESHGEPVGARAWPLVVGPRVGDEPAALPEDEGGARCRGKERRRAVRRRP